MAIAFGDEEAQIVIIGNGPSALILSYILNGHIPYYTGRHDDRILDKALSTAPNLLKVNPATYHHLQHDLRYSSQNLPINTLLDTLIRPNGDTSFDGKTCVEWRYEPEKAIPHLVLGNAPFAGGQWADNPEDTSLDIGSLSYCEQLSLPGYSFGEHWQWMTGEPLPDFTRPSRAEYSGYLRRYPTAVGISKNIRSDKNVTSVTRTHCGFQIAPFDIYCQSLVLATGVFSIRIPPPRFLNPLTALRSDRNDGAILVIGSGFTAADIIISSPPGRKIIHLFKWDPANRPSPLKACHGSTYPEYAWIYRQMKLAAEKKPFSTGATGDWTPRAQIRRTPASATKSFSQRNWISGYEGFANARILSMTGDEGSRSSSGDDDYFTEARQPPSRHEFQDRATVEIGRSSFGHRIARTITYFHYAVGRRSTLSYLDPPLRAEVLALARPFMEEISPPQLDCYSPRDKDFAASYSSPLISGSSLRGKIEDLAEVENPSAAGLELAPNVFAIGSLTGDSLIRFVHGGCCAVAGAIEDRLEREASVPLEGGLEEDWQQLENNWWIWA